MKWKGRRCVVLGAEVGGQGGRGVGIGSLAWGGVGGKATWWGRMVYGSMRRKDRGIVVAPCVFFGLVFSVCYGGIGKLRLRAWIIEVGVSKSGVDGRAISGIGRR